MRLAHSSLQANNVPQAERYLEACLPQPGQRDLRGWEWHYLKRQCHTERCWFRGHSDALCALDVSLDGRRVASVSLDGNGKVWDAATGEVLWAFSRTSEHSWRLRRVAFSPDGRLLAYSDVAGNVVTLFDAATGSVVQSLPGHDPTFSADGQRLATIDIPAKQVVVYDVQGWAKLQSFGIEWLRGFTQMALGFRGQGLWIAGTTSDHSLVVRDVQSGQQHVLAAARTMGPSALVLSRDFSTLRFSRDGERLAFGSISGTIKAWETEGGKPLFAISGHKGRIDSLAFSPDGQQLASGDIVGAVRIWNLSGQLLRSLPGHGMSIARLAYGGDGRLLVTASTDKTAKVWDLTQDADVLVIRSPSTYFRDLVFSPDSRRVAASVDRSVLVWDAATGKLSLEAHPATTRVEAAIREVAFSGDGHTDYRRRIRSHDHGVGRYQWAPIEFAAA